MSLKEARPTLPTSVASSFSNGLKANEVLDVRFGSKADMCGATKDVR